MSYNVGDTAVLRQERGYVKLEDGEEMPDKGMDRTCCRWTKLILALIFLGLSAVVFFKWLAPFITNKEIIPIMEWIETFSKTKLAIMIFTSLATFPALLLPSSPSMWLAGITFGYGYGFLLTISAVAIGVSIPYVIGSLFYNRMQEWLDRYPKKASVIRLSGEGDFFDQFQAVMLIRISPFPYIIYNYCAVATDVMFGPYLLGTLAGMVPEIFLTLYTGILIQTLANASSHDQPLSVSQIIFTIAGFCLTVAATAVVTFFAKKRLKKLQKEEGLLFNTTP